MATGGNRNKKNMQLSANREAKTVGTSGSVDSKNSKKIDDRRDRGDRQCFLSKEPKWNKVEGIKCPSRGKGRAPIGLGK